VIPVHFPARHFSTKSKEDLLMNNKNAKEPPSPKTCDSAADEASKLTSKWSYHLVVIMLLILAGLALLTISLPYLVLYFHPSDTKDLAAFSKELADYSKWALSVLLGAFGAWIGAGAAYFFGKENLKESSRSTESALRIQRDALVGSRLGEQVKDMDLTAINSNFIFDTKSQKNTVVDGLKDLLGYWFVPIVDATTGALKDVIHARVFWGPASTDNPTIEAITAELDKKDETRKLHGAGFYIEISLDDKIGDVYNLMTKKRAEVAIVVDASKKPTHCVSKMDLRAFLKMTDNR
jgi:hypothetical protein